MIETARLHLRPFGIDDFEARCAMSSDPEVMRHVTGGKPASREDIWNRLLRYAGHWQIFDYGIFAVFEKESGQFLGETGLADFHRGLGETFDPFPEAAWMFTRAVHGQGFAYEAAKAAHDWMMARRKPERTVCLISPQNEASLRLAAKLGYVAFGTATYRDHDAVMLKC